MPHDILPPAAFTEDRHTDAERLNLIERVLLAAPPMKSFERMSRYKQISFYIEEDKHGWPTIRETLDKQLDKK